MLFARHTLRCNGSLRCATPRLPTQSVQPEAAGCDDCDGGEEVSGEPVVACRYAPPVLHPAEHALDDVAAAVGYAIERIGMTAAAIGGDDDLGADRLEWLAEMVSIIRLSASTRRGGAMALSNVAATLMSAMLPAVSTKAIGLP